MTRPSIWTLRLRRPIEPTSVRLGKSWLVLSGSSCPVCNLWVSGEGALVHGCGEHLEVAKTNATLILVLRYPAGYVTVRSDDLWEHYLLKAPVGVSGVESDSRVPLSTVQGAPWVIWSGDDVPHINWPKASQCPECGKEHSDNAHGVVFRCVCRARLLPLGSETIDSFTEDMVVDELWDEQALILKVCGVRMLLSTLTFGIGSAIF